MPPSVLYRSLCISDISRNISDNSLKEEIYKKFEKFGDFFNIKISFFNNQRVAYINFTYDEDARKAYQEYHNLFLFNRPAKIEPVPIKNSRRNRQDSHSPPLSPYYKKQESPLHQLEARRPRDNYYDYNKDYYGDINKSRYDDLYDDERNFRKPRYREEPFYPLDATRSLFVGNIPDDIEESEVYKIFKMFGPITDVDVKRAIKGKNNTYSFVKYFTLDFALKARDEMQGELIGNMPCKIGYGKPSPTKKLWVGGLGPWTTLGLLEKEFDKFGPILKIDYIKGDSFAFILYENIDAAEAAYLDMKGIYLLGENAPYSRIMTDFADTKHAFYDGSSVTEFLETYHKPINYLPIIRKNAAERIERTTFHDDYRNSNYHDDLEYRNRKKSGANYDEHEEGEMPDEEFNLKRYGRSNVIASSQEHSSHPGTAGGYATKRSTSPYGYNFPGTSPKRSRRYMDPYKEEIPLEVRSNTMKYKNGNITQKHSAPGDPYIRSNYPDDGGQRPLQDSRGGDMRFKGSGRQFSASSSQASSSSQSPDASKNKSKNTITTKNKMSASSCSANSPTRSPIRFKDLPRDLPLNIYNTVDHFDKLLNVLEPCIWSGDFGIKNSLFPLDIYYFPDRGDRNFCRNQILPYLKSNSELQIVQRFRLDSAKIDDMAKLIHFNRNEQNLYNDRSTRNSGGEGNVPFNTDIPYSLFIAVDNLKDIVPGVITTEASVDGKSQHKRLLKDLIHYLRQKNAAGVIFLTSSSATSKDNNAKSTTHNHFDTNASSNSLIGNTIMYAFPPCDFTQKFFASNFPKIDVSSMSNVDTTSIPPSSSSGNNNTNYLQNHLLIIVLHGAAVTASANKSNKQFTK